MANPTGITASDMATASSANHFQYAVPVTIESFSKAFIAHKHWAPRHWIPQMRSLSRALYTIESPHSSSRQIRRRLPTEIIDIIAQYVNEAAVAQGFLELEQLLGVIKTPASLEVETRSILLEKWQITPEIGDAEEKFVLLEKWLQTPAGQEIEKGLTLLENWGFSWKTFIANAEEDTLSKFMMERYSLSLMPGMKNNIAQYAPMTHLFLCFSSSSDPSQPVKIQDWTPSEHPHPALSDESVQGAPSTQRPIVDHTAGLSVSTIHILEKEFVEKALDGKSAIGRAVREMQLEVIALAQMS